MGSIVYLDYGNDNWNYSITNYCTSSFFFVTGYSTFFWLSKLMLVLEAFQKGIFNSIPFWIETSKKKYKEEIKELKGTIRV